MSQVISLIINIDWQVASQMATVGAFVFTGFTFAVTFWRTKRSEQLRLIREILKDRGHLASQLMELETKKTLSDPTESGVYIVPIRDLYINILNLWSEFVFLSQFCRYFKAIPLCHKITS